MVANKSNKLEKEYVIPLREKCRSVPIYKKTPKAVKSVKEFLVRHMQIRDRDLKKIKIDRFLNEQLWQRGIKKPLHKVKVKAIKEGDIVRVYSMDLPADINFKKIREEKRESAGKEASEKKKESQKTMMEKAKDQIKAGKEEKVSKEKDNDGVDEKVEEKEKQEAVEEAMEKEAKEEAKEEKHTTKPKSPKEEKDSHKKYNKSSRGH